MRKFEYGRLCQIAAIRHRLKLTYLRMTNTICRGSTGQASNFNGTQTFHRTTQTWHLCCNPSTLLFFLEGKSHFSRNFTIWRHDSFQLLDISRQYRDKHFRFHFDQVPGCSKMVEIFALNWLKIHRDHILVGAWNTRRSAWAFNTGSVAQTSVSSIPKGPNGIYLYSRQFSLCKQCAQIYTINGMYQHIHTRLSCSNILMLTWTITKYIRTERLRWLISPGIAAQPNLANFLALGPLPAVPTVKSIMHIWIPELLHC